MLNLQLSCAELRDDLFRRVLLRSWHRDAVLRLCPIDPILAQVVDAFEGGRSGADPAEDRMLWYWNPETELVVPAVPTTRLQIRKTPSLHTTISADAEIAPPPLKIAAPVAADMRFHNHLVLYGIDEAAPTGAYGFFAWLTSDVYEASSPLLLVFNPGVFDFEQMIAAALAINAAAVDSLPRPHCRHARRVFRQRPSRRMLPLLRRGRPLRLGRLGPGRYERPLDPRQQSALRRRADHSRESVLMKNV